MTALSKLTPRHRDRASPRHKGDAGLGVAGTALSCESGRGTPWNGHLVMGQGATSKASPAEALATSPMDHRVRAWHSLAVTWNGWHTSVIEGARVRGLCTRVSEARVQGVHMRYRRKIVTITLVVVAATGMAVGVGGVPTRCYTNIANTRGYTHLLNGDWAGSEPRCLYADADSGNTAIWRCLNAPSEEWLKIPARPVNTAFHAA